MPYLFLYSPYAQSSLHVVPTKQSFGQTYNIFWEYFPAVMVSLKTQQEKLQDCWTSIFTIMTADAQLQSKVPKAHNIHYTGYEGMTPAVHGQFSLNRTAKRLTSRNTTEKQHISVSCDTTIHTNSGTCQVTEHASVTMQPSLQVAGRLISCSLTIIATAYLGRLSLSVLYLLYDLQDDLFNEIHWTDK